MIPKPNLDDRTFDDIVDEAIRLIPRYCPEWTNHNTTDPGITLVELFAWMTETVLYRLNKVPEKTYLSALELMGLSLIPPRAARSVINFIPVEGYRKSILVKAGTQIASTADSSGSCIFETEKDIQVNNSSLVSCINRQGEKWTDFCENGTLQPFTLFEATDSVDHFLYISSPIFAFLSGGHHVQLSFEAIQELASVREEIINYLYWELWDGRSSMHIEAHRSISNRKKKDNTIYFSGPYDIQPSEANGKEGFYLRALLSEVPDNKVALSTKRISVQPYFGGSGFIPDSCISNSSTQYEPIDMNTSFRIFSELPSYNEIFYLAADNVLCHTGTKVHISFFFSEVYVSGDENEAVLFSYEFWDGFNWNKLNTDADKFLDSTFGFKQAGEVSFIVPHAIQKTIVNSEEHLWIRIRLLTKDFSIGGTYIKDDKDNWVWKFTKKVHSPIFSKIRITYDARAEQPEHVSSYSNFNWQEFKTLSEPKKENIPDSEELLFDIHAESTPALFLGFSSEFPKGDTSIYFKIAEEHSSKPKPAQDSFFNTFAPEHTERRLIDFAWEYWNGKEWSLLSVNDYTDSFHESGFIEFSAPNNMKKTDNFGKNLYWLRVRMLTGSFELQPKIQGIILNAVYARHCKTWENEIAGSGTGAPGQWVRPAHLPLLPGAVIYIDEGSIPPTNELDILKNDGISDPYYTEGDSVWVCYKEVDNFYASTPLSRHYVIDYQTGTIHFGDGQRGIIPLRRKFNILLKSYTTGGGTDGNAAAHTLKIPVQGIPFLTECNNPFAAEGGAEMESIDNLKARAAGVIKSLNRAVTAEDFEWIAREASASVGRSCCLNKKNIHDEICVYVIPVMLPEIDKYVAIAKQLVPSRELLRQVSLYLSDRVLVGTRYRVLPPVYKICDIRIYASFRNDVRDTEQLKKNILFSLKSFFHPLLGDNGKGWQFGKDITIGAVLKQLEKIDGILSIDEIELFDTDAGVIVEKILLADDELPYIDNVQIENRRNRQ